jgi:hypothetical protein
MPGLSLRSGGSAHTTINYSTPFTPPASAAAATGGSMSVAQQAYGRGAGGGGNGPKTASLGSTVVSSAAVFVLIYVWWSLPR